jgi:hypothetical protein
MMRFVNRGGGVGLVVLAILMAGLLTAVPTSAESAWDPDDVEGPLDLRWLGASFIPHDRTKLTVSFYDDFRVGALAHRRGQVFHRGVRVKLAKHLQGVFRVRSNGHIVFIYGDFGSSCCSTARVEWPSRTVLRVVIPTFNKEAGFGPYRVRAISTWYHHGERVRDRTRELRLGFPPGD